MAGAVFLGALVQSGIGFGLALVASPALVWIYPDLMPGTMVMLGLATNVAMIAREWRWIDRRGVAWVSLGLVPGTVLGGWLVALVPHDLTGVLVGVAVLLAVALQGTRRAITRNTPNLFTAGFVSGAAGTVSGIGGPPVAMMYASSPGSVVRGTLAAIFLVSTALSLVALGAVGRLAPQQFGLMLILQPAMLAGYWAAKPLARVLDRGYTRPAILILAAVAGLVLLVTSLVDGAWT